MPACSSASHEPSRSSRCCGSIADASRGEMPKNAASKAPASWRNPPRYVSVPQPRSAGWLPVASVPSVTRRHRSRGDRIPPGRRQLMPTMAMASSASSGVTAGSGAAASSTELSPCVVLDSISVASASGVGWSNTTLVGRFSEVAEFRRRRSSTAMAESKPRSWKVRPASSASGAAWRSTAAAWVRTSSRAAMPGVLRQRDLGGGAAVTWGRSSGVSGVPVTALQSTAAPRTKSSAAEVRTLSRPPSPRRSVPVATASVTPVSAAVSSTPMVSTGCGLHSTKNRYPSSRSPRTAWSKHTGRRSLRTQYPASSRPPSTQAASTVEYTGTEAVLGDTPASSRPIRSATWSTCGECEA
ncbi:hypothetical protein EES44_30025 [Streptomyces sp. ADI96-15]|nr:hypothetical protein EES44_30025 [Streptomyces sp. ADI96-15]